MSAPSAPQDRPRVIVLTFDNLGEASERERGRPDAAIAPGRHPSVTVALPRLLDELDALDLRGTFFVEAVNCELYPDALSEIAERGHELGVHGWRHEPWSQLPAARERELLERAGRAFAPLGVPATAFRPPGGEPTAGTAALLRALGYRWWSPAIGSPHTDGGPVLIPFDWELVDAFHLMERFGALRARRSASREPLSAGAVAERMGSGLAAGPGVQAVVLHPFLMIDDAWWEGARRVLARIAELGRGGEAWTGPGGELAALIESGGG